LADGWGVIGFFALGARTIHSNAFHTNLGMSFGFRLMSFDPRW
jgi:hypothetical protein